MTELETQLLIIRSQAAATWYCQRGSLNGFNQAWEERGKAHYLPMAQAAVDNPTKCPRFDLKEKRFEGKRWRAT